MIPLLVGLAGGLGAIARFSLDSWVSSHWDSPLPLGTVVVNVSGSLLLGVLTGWALQSDASAVLAILGTGFLGGYTTFSTASVEAARLARSGRGLGAVVHASTMLLLGLGAALLGLWLTGP
ncbi:MAG: CrcB family protein [Propionibacteriaceae bacterium]|nr:CrcB family protein [Propionibacteriaceae bacterium]